jgi:hypothetical protein
MPNLARYTPQWPATLPFEVALGIHPLDEILLRHDLDRAQWAEIEGNKVFRQELIGAQQEIAESGLSFKRRAALQAELYLEEVDNLMLDPDTAPSLKLEIFKTMVKCGDLEPVPAKDKDAGSNQTFNIQINI